MYSIEIYKNGSSAWFLKYDVIVYHHSRQIFNSPAWTFWGAKRMANKAIKYHKGQAEKNLIYQERQ